MGVDHVCWAADCLTSSRIPFGPSKLDGAQSAELQRQAEPRVFGDHGLDND